MDAEELNRLTARLDRILESLSEGAGPEVSRAVAELLEGLQRVHAEGLRRLAQLLARQPEMLERSLDDPVISNLFYLYDLTVVDAEDRVEEALTSARVMARSHGGELELLGVEDGRVRLRIHWSHDAVSREPDTLRKGIEWALRERLPGFRDVEVEGLDPDEATAGGDGPVDAAVEAIGGSGGRSLPVMGGQSVVPDRKVSRLEERLDEAKGRAGSRGGRADRSPRRVNLLPRSQVPRDGLHGELVYGYPVLVVGTEDGPRAYRNTCPGTMLPLHFGDREGGEIVCRWHGCRFDVATGRRLDEDAAPLVSLDAGVDGGHLWVEVPVRSRTDARAEGRG